MNPDFLQICKSDKKIGLGHVMRSLSIYSKIKEINKKVVFFYIGSSSMAISIIKNNVLLDDLVLSENSDFANEIINANTTIILDIPENQKISFDKKIKNRNIIVVFDFLNDFNFKNKLFFTPIPDLTIDEKIDKSYYFDGPKYVLLRPMFQKYHEKVRTIKPFIKKILITFGGSDPKMYTEIFLRIIPQLIKNNFKILLILPNQRKIKSELLYKNDNLTIFNEFVKIHEIGLSVDLTICSGGGTLWEMCCLGTPTIAIPQTKSELQAISYLRSNNSCVTIDKTKFSSSKIIKKITHLNQNYDLRKSLSKNGKSEVDGMGMNRIFEKISHFKENN